MAEFRAGETEVYKLVEDFVAESRKYAEENNLQGDEKESCEQERNHFQQKVPEYFEARRSPLNSLVAAMAELNVEGGKRWEANIHTLVGAQRILQGILVNIKYPTPDGVLLKLSIEQEEKAFIQGLADIGMDRLYEELFQIQIRLLNEEVNCHGAWILLVEEVKKFAKTAESSVTDLLHALGKVSYSTDPWTGPAEGAVKTLTELAASGPIGLDALRTDVDTCLTTYGKSLDEGALYANALRGAIDSAKAHSGALSSLQATEIETLHRLFREQRQKTVDYVNISPFDKAGQIKDAARNAFDTWISSLPGDREGMKEDATELRTDVLLSFTEILAGISDTYTRFKAQNEGAFFGTVSDTTIRTLAQMEAWASLRSKVTDAKFADKLRAVKNQINRPELNIKPVLDTLVSAVEHRADPPADKAAFLTAVNEQGAKLVTALDTRRADLNQLANDGLAMIEGSELSGLLNRQEVENSLRDT